MIQAPHLKEPQFHSLFHHLFSLVINPALNRSATTEHFIMFLQMLTAPDIYYPNVYLGRHSGETMLLMAQKLQSWLVRIRKHIQWRLFIGLMAVIGGTATIASLYRDVLVPVFRPAKELRREIELVELLKLFAPDPNHQTPEWTTAASLDSPIEWQSDERNGNPPSDGFFSRFSVARTGTTTVKINGEPTHNQFDKYIHPASWTITMYGCMAGIQCIGFSSDGSGFTDPPNIMAALAKYTQLVQSHPKNAHTFRGNLYKLSLPGKKDSWLVEDFGQGNHAWFITLILFPGTGSYPLANQCMDQLLL